MAGLINYGDKSQGQASGFPTNQKWTFQDANEVKNVVNINSAETASNTSNKLGNTLSSLVSASSFVNQVPAGTDTPLLIEFGAAQGGGGDPVQIDVNGTITFNQPGVYFFAVDGEFGRTGAAGVSILKFRAEINGVGAGPVLTAQIDTSDITYPLDISFILQAVATDTLEFFVMRDSVGNNSGELKSIITTLVGWDNSPSARVLIQRFI